MNSTVALSTKLLLRPLLFCLGTVRCFEVRTARLDAPLLGKLVHWCVRQASVIESASSLNCTGTAREHSNLTAFGAVAIGHGNRVPPRTEAPGLDSARSADGRLLEASGRGHRLLFDYAECRMGPSEPISERAGLRVSKMRSVIRKGFLISRVWHLKVANWRD